MASTPETFLGFLGRALKDISIAHVDNKAACLSIFLFHLLHDSTGRPKKRLNLQLTC